MKHHPSVQGVIDHLEEDAEKYDRSVDRIFRDIAYTVANMAPSAANDLTVAMRKLVEAKDAVNRAINTHERP